jgi:CDP-6-deoxy-D-xylo-4-hexulose-3-dehydrase
MNLPIDSFGRNDKFFSHESERFLIKKMLVPVAGVSFDEHELYRVNQTLKNGWISQGKMVDTFEKNFASYLGRKHAIAVNSGTSAITIGLKSLMEKGTLKKGDEVIIPALNWITTVAPLFQLGLTPCFTDINLNENSEYFLNIDFEQVPKLISKKTKAIISSNFLGAPESKKKIMDSKLLSIEDSCDALGAEFNDQKVGTFGIVSMFSFFVAHHITTGEGGMITTDNDDLNKICRSLRAFGRLCICPVCMAKDDYCPIYKTSKSINVRYNFNYLGYSMKMTDIEAAMGIEQLEKLDSFIAIRKRNARKLVDKLSKYDSLLIPRYLEGSSWFGFPIVVKKGAPFTRDDLVSYLEKNGIETRMLLTGDVTSQPALKGYKYKKIDLTKAQFASKNGFYIGCWQGITEEMNQYQVEKIVEFLDNTRQT